MSQHARAARAPTAAELDRLAHDRDDLPWLAACWIETSLDGTDALHWTLDARVAPDCARTHLLAGRRALARTRRG